MTNLKEIRQRLGISLRGLAEATGLQAKTINNIENQKQKPNKSTLTLLSIILSELSGDTINPDDLLTIIN